MLIVDEMKDSRWRRKTGVARGRHCTDRVEGSSRSVLREITVIACRSVRCTAKTADARILLYSKGCGGTGYHGVLHPFSGQTSVADRGSGSSVVERMFDAVYTEPGGSTFHHCAISPGLAAVGPRAYQGPRPSPVYSLKRVHLADIIREDMAQTR